MPAPTSLARLIEPAAVARLIDAAAGLAPGATIRLVDGAGHQAPRTMASQDAAREVVAFDGTTLGAVEVLGAGETGPAVAHFVARAVEMAAAEALRRRAVGAAAIHDLRELSLLSRLSTMLGDSLEPAAIAGCTLSAVARPLHSAVGLVLDADDRTQLASSGKPGDIASLGAAAGPLIERLRADEPVDGTCAEGTHADGGSLASILVASLRTARGYQGSIALARAAGAAPFNADDRRLLAAVARQAAIAIERAGLQRQIGERRVLDHELEIGRRIQISLMPRRFPDVPGWQIASAYEPAREVGGDFYDVFPLRDRPGVVGLVVADVTGKGIPAAILMADSRALIHAAADHGSDPADTLARVNRILVAERASGLFVTVAHAILDAPSGRLRMASAGHDPVHVLRVDGGLEVLDPPGRLMGMVDNIAAATVDVWLAPGDAWIGHTDGVTEARDPTGDFYGEGRFRDLLVRLAGQPADLIVTAVMADVAAFRGPAEPSDDVTLLVVCRTSATGGADPG